MTHDLSILMHERRGTIAMVGTRNPTPRQAQHAARCASRVASIGHAYVSGGAKGIDTITRDAYAQSTLRSEITILRPDKIAVSERPALCNILNIALGEEWYKALQRKGDYVLNLALRNVQIVDEADIVLAWPGTTSTGTQQAIAIAHYLHTPCFDMNQWIIEA